MPISCCWKELEELPLHYIIGFEVSRSRITAALHYGTVFELFRSCKKKQGKAPREVERLAQAMAKLDDRDEYEMSRDGSCGFSEEVAPLSATVEMLP